MTDGIVAHLVAATTMIAEIAAATAGPAEVAAAMTVSMVLYPSGTIIVMSAIDMSTMRTTCDAS